MLNIIQIFLLFRYILMHLTFPEHARTGGEGGGMGVHSWGADAPLAGQIISES